MKVFIRKNSDNEFASVNFFVAYEGFKEMGWEIISFNAQKPIENLELDNVVVGYIFYLDYAKFLSAKWSEMTGAEDYCNF